MDLKKISFFLVLAILLVGCANQDFPTLDKQGNEVTTKSSLLDEAKKRIPEVKRLMSQVSTRSSDEELRINGNIHVPDITKVEMIHKYKVTED